MQLAILGDTHFGARNDAKWWFDYMDKFYSNVFFPTLLERNVEHIVQVGDLFDRRKFINYNTLHMARETFFDKIVEHGLIMNVIPGNHDVYYKNTLRVNSIQLLLNDYYPSIYYYTEPTTLDHYGLMIDLIPWICEENKAEIQKFIYESTSRVCIGHLQLQGYLMDQFMTCLDGMNRADFQKYEKVISGHFHHRSNDGKVFYVGSPGEMNWVDFDDQRGFHILDTDTLDLEFIPNPYKLHLKYNYDGLSETLDSVNALDYKQYKDTIVRIVVRNRTDSPVFDVFMKHLEEVNPIEIQVEEVYIDNSDHPNNIDDTKPFDTGDSLAALSQYVEDIEMPLDKEQLKAMIHKIHAKALDFESLEGISDVEF